MNRALLRWSILASSLLAACATDQRPAYDASPARDASVTDLSSPQQAPWDFAGIDFSANHWSDSVDGGLAGGRCVDRVAHCLKGDDVRVGYEAMNRLLMSCGMAELPICSTLRVTFDADGCAISLLYNGAPLPAAFRDCVAGQIGTSRWPCFGGTEATVVGFCE